MNGESTPLNQALGHAPSVADASRVATANVPAPGPFDNVWFEHGTVTWAELVRLLRQHGFEELRTGKGTIVSSASRIRSTDMTSHYPVVLEHEANGTVSAYVVGLPGVFAAADNERAAAAGIRKALRAHLAAVEALDAPRHEVRATLRVAKVSSRQGAKTEVGFVGLGALMGRQRSPKKAAAARANGQKGGRPRTARRSPR